MFIQTQQDSRGQWHNNVATISDCSFTNNSAVNVGQINGTGGALYMSGSQGKTKEKYSILDSMFQDNTATGASSDILTWGVSTVDIDRSSFHFGYGKGGAGALYAYGFPARYTDVMIHNSVFTGVGGFCSVQLSSCSCIGIINSTFSDTQHRGLCIQDTSGACEGTDPYLSISAQFLPRLTMKSFLLS